MVPSTWYGLALNIAKSKSLLHSFLSMRYRLTHKTYINKPPQIYLYLMRQAPSTSKRFHHLFLNIYNLSWPPRHIRNTALAYRCVGSITEVKQRQAWSIIGWVTAWDMRAVMWCRVA